MKLYLGIGPQNLKEGYSFERVLLSYYAIKNNYLKHKDEIDKYDLFLDSGAFSAFNSKAIIKVDDYISFLKQNDFKDYAALDVIYNPEETRANFEKMIKAGLNPIPTFHYKTPIEELEYFMQFPYIALGGLVPLAAKKETLRNWLDYCFSKLHKKITEDGLKVHGFGVLNIEVLKRYPFYSVDGTSWNMGARFGSAYKLDGIKFRGEKNPLVAYQKYTRSAFKLNQNNINEYLKVEKVVTDIWKERGIEFKDKQKHEQN